jgi:RNA polymerase sigma factor (TIGR02999 family)
MSEPSDPIPSPGDRPRPAADLLPLVYDELRRLAAHRLANESLTHTLQPTALVHEAYLRLANAGTRWDGPRHFYAAAAEAMRRILVDVARRKGRVKRGGDRGRQALDPETIAAPDAAHDLLALDEALGRFAAIEPDIAELVKLRYFGGLTLKDAAATLGFAPRTADAHWAYARAWLLAEVQRCEG